MSNLEKAILGALGGLSAVLVKFLGQDYANVVAHAANLTADQVLAYKLGYGLLTPILMFLGGFIGWVSDERKRVKIVALAIAAPAMITTWSGGQKLESTVASHSFFVSTAYADPLDTLKEKFLPTNTDEITYSGTWDKLKSGVGAFFGYDNKPKRYWVIVGSFSDHKTAQRFADAINAKEKTLNAWVGRKSTGSNYFPVIVGDYLFLAQAKRLKQRALETKLIKDAYLSTGESRR